MTTVLHIHACGQLMVETGRYDTGTHKWICESSRPATDADLPYPLKPREEIDPYFE